MKYIIEKNDMYKGYNYIVKLFEDGHRCGYVKVPEDHKFYQKKYDDIPIECHGGLTFSECGNEECGFSEGYWIGFDCAHFNDLYDTEKALEIWKDNQRINCMDYFGNQTLKTTEYVEQECKHIIDQLIN